MFSDPSCSGLTLVNSLKDCLVFSILHLCLTPPDWHSSWSTFLICGIDYAPGKLCRWWVTAAMPSDWPRFSKSWYMSQDESLLFRERSLFDGFMGHPFESKKTVWFSHQRFHLPLWTPAHPVSKSLTASWERNLFLRSQELQWVFEYNEYQCCWLTNGPNDWDYPW